MTDLPRDISDLISEYGENTLRVRNGTITFSALNEDRRVGNFEGAVQIKSGVWTGVMSPKHYSLGTIWQALIFHHSSFDITTLPSLNVPKIDFSDVVISNTVTLCSEEKSVSFAADLLHPLDEKNSYTNTPRLLPKVWGNSQVLIFIFKHYFYAGRGIAHALSTYIDNKIHEMEKKYNMKGILEYDESEISDDSEKDIRTLHSVLFHTCNIRKYFPASSIVSDEYITIFISEENAASIQDAHTNHIAEIPISEGGPFVQEVHGLFLLLESIDNNSFIGYPWIEALYNRILDDPNYTGNPWSIDIISEGEYKLRV